MRLWTNVAFVKIALVLVSLGSYAHARRCPGRPALVVACRGSGRRPARRPQYRQRGPPQGGRVCRGRVCAGRAQTGGYRRISPARALDLPRNR